MKIIISDHINREFQRWEGVNNSKVSNRRYMLPTFTDAMGSSPF